MKFLGRCFISAVMIADLISYPAVAAQLSGKAARLPNIMAPKVAGPRPVPANRASPSTVFSPADGSSPLINPAASTPVTGGIALPATVLPESLPVILIDQTPLDPTTLDGPVRIRARFETAVGTALTAQHMREVVLRGTIEVKNGTPVKSSIKWTTLQRPDSGRMALLPVPLASSFSSGQGALLKSGQSVNAAGDYRGVIDTVNNLYAAAVPVTVPAAAPTGGDAAAAAVPPANVAPTGSGQVNSSGSSLPASTASSGLPKFRPISSSPPASPAAVAASSADPAPVMGTTTAGCPARVDLANNTVVIQSKITTDGTATGTCTDTEKRFTLQKAYTTCTDVIDRPSAVAHPQYRRYWVDSGGTTQYVDANCQPDLTSDFALVEDSSACTATSDMTTLLTTLRSQLVYKDKSGRTVIVDGCRATPGAAPIQITLTAAGCGLRNDFAAGVSYELKQAWYVRPDGVQAIAQPCTDTGVTFSHVKVSGSPTCQDVYSLTNGTAFKQFRTQITLTDGTMQYISDCAPDLATSQNLVKTVAGCESTFYDYISAGQSFGAARWYHTLNGPKEYVTSCQEDQTAVYPHQVSITGYVNNDVGKYSEPSTRIHFVAPVVGDHTVSATQVRAGAAQIPYTLNRVETRLGTNITYTGCDRYQDQNNYSIYIRADASEYAEFKAAGTPVGPVYACKSTVSPMPWGLLTNSGTVHGNCSFIDANGKYQSMTSNSDIATYKATRTLTREDGTVISTTSAQKSTSAWSCTPSPNDVFAPVANMSQSNTWNASLGW